MASLSPAVTPVDQIRDAREAFPYAIIRFELELTGAEVWTALHASSQMFGKSGAVLETLRCMADGSIFCRLRDTPDFEPTVISAALSDMPWLQLDRWTIVVATGAPPESIYSE